MIQCNAKMSFAIRVGNVIIYKRKVVFCFVFSDTHHLFNKQIGVVQLRLEQKFQKSVFYCTTTIIIIILFVQV